MNLAQDVRFAIRQWARQPGLTAMAVLTLALGVGGSTTMYGFLQAVARFGQPTVPEPERVARLFTAVAGQRDDRGLVSFDDYRHWRQTSRSFEALAAYKGKTLPLRTAEGVDDVSVLAITPSYLLMLKTPPAIGRIFTEEEVRSSDGRLAVLSERAWRSRFGGDPAAPGRAIDLDGRSHTVVGVMAERLGLVMPTTDVFVPLMERNASASVMVIGRRHASVSWDQARSELNALGAGDRRIESQVRVIPILDDARFRTRMGWLVFIGPPLLVLLIGCGNVACLLLVRAVQREREMAVRLAIGALRRRIAMQLLVEGWALAAAGGMFGVVVAFFGMQGVRSLFPASLDIRLGIDARTLLFAGIATLLTPLVFGTAPLLHGIRRNLTEGLRASLHKPLFGVGQYHLRDLFAILEVGLAVALVVLTFMLSVFFIKMRSLDLNFDGEDLVIARISPREGAEIKAGGVATEIAGRLLARVAAVPGVARAAMGELPFGGDSVRVRDSPSGAAISARRMHVDSDYFETLGLPIARGRSFEASDAFGTSHVAIVNESLAARFWPNTNPLGQDLYVSNEGQNRTVTVVGVSKDAVRLGRLDHMDVHPLEFRHSVFRPWSQGSSPRFDVIARVHGESASLFAPMRKAVHDVDRRFRLRQVVSLGSTVDATGGEAPIVLYLLGIFGGLALLLAIIGVFGVMSQLVDERRPEMGIRLALGASSRELVTLVIQDGMIRVGVGVALALIGVFVGARFGFPDLLTLSASGPWFWIAIVAVVAATASAACYLPARHAARIDPMEALRCE